jgi:hypothetical protein
LDIVRITHRNGELPDPAFVLERLIHDVVVPQVLPRVSGCVVVHRDRHCCRPARTRPVVGVGEYDRRHVASFERFHARTERYGALRRAAFGAGEWSGEQAGEELQHDAASW